MTCPNDYIVSSKDGKTVYINSYGNAVDSIPVLSIEMKTCGGLPDAFPLPLPCENDSGTLSGKVMADYVSHSRLAVRGSLSLGSRAEETCASRGIPTAENFGLISTDQSIWVECTLLKKSDKFLFGVCAAKALDASSFASR
jgi:hypothetical protein